MRVHLLAFLLVLPAVVRASRPESAEPSEPKPTVVAAALVAPNADDPEVVEAVEAADAIGIQEDVNEGRRELDEMQKAEAQVLGDESVEPSNTHRVGLTSPLRLRAMDSFDRDDVLPGPHTPSPQGNAGALLPELEGLDIAALKASFDIPIEINEDVIQYIKFFQGRGRQWFEKWLARSHRWVPIMRPILAEEGAPLDLVYLAMIESGFSAYAYSWARASGFWQFISPTGRHFGLRDDFWVDERRDPVLATRAAARYLKALHKEFGDWHLAWAGYNAGEGKIRRAIKMYGTRNFWELTRAGRYLKPETKHYVPKLIAAAIVAKHPERFGFTNVVPEGPFEWDEVEVPDATDLQVVARAAGISAEEIQQMNMPLRRACTPPARSGLGYRIKLPKGRGASFAAEYAKVAPAERLTFRHHRVVRGDTLGGIAGRYGMPSDAIMKLNGVKNARALRLGMDLIIPLPTQIASKYPDLPSTWKEPRAKTRGGKGRTTSKRLARGVEREVERKAPGKNQYVIRSGDTLWSIAQRFGCDIDELKRWNQIGRRGHQGLQVGRALHVAPPASGKTNKGRG